MKIMLRYMGKKHRFREMPEVRCLSPGGSISLKVGKRYFDVDPCKPQCDPLIAKSANLKELRRFYRPRCCK